MLAGVRSQEAFAIEVNEVRSRFPDPNFRFPRDIADVLCHVAASEKGRNINQLRSRILEKRRVFQDIEMIPDRYTLYQCLGFKAKRLVGACAYHGEQAAVEPLVLWPKDTG